MPKPHRSPARAFARVAAAVTALVAGVAGVALASPAVAAPTPAPTPGNFSGYAFDARCAPTQEEMDAWLAHSPFWGAGIYLGGSMMSCGSGTGDPGQQHLDATWVRRQSAAGWRLLPIWVGPQASCSTRDFADDIDPEPGSTGAYPAAEAQGRAEAASAVSRARALGIAGGSTLWYDLEDFDVAETDCRRSALRFLSGWTLGLRSAGYRSGVYSNIDAGIHALDYADQVSRGSYEMPDQVWYAWENGAADTRVKPDKVRSSSWAGERVHQYELDETATYGGVTLSIDRNYLEVGGGSVAPPARRVCGGVRLDRGHYPALKRGRSGAAVRVLQCLLKEHTRYRERLDGRFDRGVVRGVRSFQRKVGHRTNGRVTARTWTALLARGETPLLKEGSAGHAVRHLQRALTAATPGRVTASGVLDRSTSVRLVRYQRQVGVPATGVVGPDTWAALRAGRR
ncbi:glycoside hydrolase domain-containing protein [Nocardioides sp. SYSU DS0663]|uniref:glycoside hydrolase domain-containing protein n=1 Tax=Nocardioides sp. SYSU DS0663 TaxID=3416445 RepID=UPI003F4C1287